MASLLYDAAEVYPIARLYTGEDLVRSSYESLAVGAAIDLLAASTTWQDICSAATADEAAARIIEYDGGAPANGSTAAGTFVATDGSAQTGQPPYAQVALMDMQTDTAQAIGWTRRTWKIAIGLRLPAVEGELPPIRMRRLTNVLGDIRTEIAALMNTPGYLAGSVSLTIDPLPSDDGAFRNTTSGILTLDCRNF